MVDFNAYALAAGREVSFLNWKLRLQTAIDVAEGQRSDTPSITKIFFILAFTVLKSIDTMKRSSYIYSFKNFLSELLDTTFWNIYNLKPWKCHP